MGGDNNATLPAGLPNILGSGIWCNTGNSAVSGAIYTLITTNYGGTTQTSLKGLYNGFDASKSNPIYGASGTVTPPTLQLIPQIRY